MNYENQASKRIWSVAEAKARLSEILRLAEKEGPQRIGIRRAFVVVPAEQWSARRSKRKPLGQWLVENMPCGNELDLPDRSSNRELLNEIRAQPEIELDPSPAEILREERKRR